MVLHWRKPRSLRLLRARRLVTWLTVFALVAAGVLPLMNSKAWAHLGPRLFIDLAVPSGELISHDHSKIICHSHKGHLCLEQHESADGPSPLPVFLPPDAPEYGPSTRDVRVPLPRAPTLFRTSVNASFDPRGPPFLG